MDDGRGIINVVWMRRVADYKSVSRGQMRSVRTAAGWVTPVSMTNLNLPLARQGVSPFRCRSSDPSSVLQPQHMTPYSHVLLHVHHDNLVAQMVVFLKLFIKLTHLNLGQMIEPIV